jgi:GNAT superfamily N-acetyltransferase
MKDSIAQLCTPDHRGDAAFLAKWLSNKTPDNVRRWIHDWLFFMCELDGRIGGVAAMRPDGHVTLNYVAPEVRFRGVSKALIARLEEEAKSLNLARLRLLSSQTAFAFYQSLGFVKTGEEFMAMTGTMAAILEKRFCA